MRVALDSSGNRIYASNPERYKDCFCPVCGEPLKHKICKNISNYFSHMPDSECAYGKDKDSKCEWHIRMQDYFPEETQEIRFVDEKTNEVHIADVYLKDSNTVLEFQHSSIESEEFWKRTIFHISNGRRVVWLFDESSKGKDSGNYGRFRKDDMGWESTPIYENKCYKWLWKPRLCLSGPLNVINSDRISICVYTGKEGDFFHRLIRQFCNFEYVTFSIHDIVMSNDLDIEEFFETEKRWLQMYHERLKTAYPMIMKMVLYNNRNDENSAVVDRIIDSYSKK